MKHDAFIRRLQPIIEKYQIQVQNLDYYKEALTHSSYANEHNVRHYERMEFLGDSILGFLVAEYIYKLKDITEGEMTKLRSVYVCTPANAEYSLEMGLESCLLLGKGAKEQNEESVSVLADIFESFLGAMYLDQGLEEVRKFLSTFLFPKIKKQNVNFFVDYKSQLQEYVQAESRQGVNYTLIKESGPPHNKTFEVAVFHDGVKLGTGVGKSKKEAEQNAAKEALEIMAR